MIPVVLFVSVAFLIGGYLAGTYCVKHHVRIRAAYDILRGTAELKGGAFRCPRTHIEGGCEPIKTERRKMHEEAADELKDARGYIAACEKEKTSYSAIVNDLIAEE